MPTKRMVSIKYTQNQLFLVLLGSLPLLLFLNLALLPQTYTCSHKFPPSLFKGSLLFKPPRLPYSEYFGGAIMMTPEHIEAANGFPNRFYGWGGEDDDIYARWVTFNHVTPHYSPPSAVLSTVIFIVFCSNKHRGNYHRNKLSLDMHVLLHTVSNNACRL